MTTRRYGKQGACKFKLKKDDDERPGYLDLRTDVRERAALSTRLIVRYWTDEGRPSTARVGDLGSLQTVSGVKQHQIIKCRTDRALRDLLGVGESEGSVCLG